MFPSPLVTNSTSPCLISVILKGLSVTVVYLWQLYIRCHVLTELASNQPGAERGRLIVKGDRKLGTGQRAQQLNHMDACLGFSLQEKGVSRYSPSRPRTHYGAQAGLELATTPLPPPPECWNESRATTLSKDYLLTSTKMWPCPCRDRTATARKVPQVACCSPLEERGPAHPAMDHL